VTSSEDKNLHQFVHTLPVYQGKKCDKYYFIWCRKKENLVPRVVLVPEEKNRTSLSSTDVLKDD
jgi:hypothetical protein